MSHTKNNNSKTRDDCFLWIIWNQCENGETAIGLFENIISVGGEMSPGVFELEQIAFE